LPWSELAKGAEQIAFHEGALGTVTVVRTPDGQRSLRVNGRLQMGGTAATVAERRQAHLPLLFHPKPVRALFLGPGTGITLGAALAYPSLHLDAVELVPEVVQVLDKFEPENAGVRTNRAVRWVVADARRYVRTSRERYDVIVADLFHPAQDGAGFLYTREHFEAIRGRLATGGLFCQWLPLHQLNEVATRSIVRTFIDVFPQAEAVLLHFNVDIPVLGLLGREGSASATWGELEQRMAAGELREALRSVSLERPIQLLGCLVSDADGLRRYASDAPRCTDDAPFVLFAAPRHAAQRAARSSDVLLSFLQQAGEPSAGMLLAHIPDGANGGETVRRNVKEFIGARDIYLRGLAEEASGDLGAAIERYLESAQRSLFFTPAYARMVTIVQLLASSDRARARALFERLEAARPDQPLGRRLLGPMLEQ
jgi:spermidine synthase